jgi:uncharacterized integral membrane protein
MNTFFKWLILTPIAIVIVAFSIMNRHSVPVVLDPFGSDVPGLRFEAPLFLVMFACGALGVIAGSLTTWISQGRHRRALRDMRSDIAQLRSEADRLRARTDVPAAGAPALPAPGGPDRSAA